MGVRFQVLFCSFPNWIKQTFPMLPILVHHIHTSLVGIYCPISTRTVLFGGLYILHICLYMLVAVHWSMDIGEMDGNGQPVTTNSTGHFHPFMFFFARRYKLYLYEVAIYSEYGNVRLADSKVLCRSLLDLPRRVVFNHVDDSSFGVTMTRRSLKHRAWRSR